MVTVRVFGRRINIELAVVSLGIAVGLVLIVIGLLGGRTGRDALGYPDEIESVAPAPNDRQVLRQTEIVVDLVANQEAVLVVDGIELPVTRLDELSGGLAQPGQQVELPPTAIWDPGNFIISFRPVEGAPIEEYSVGLHTATVIFWDVEEGREAARSFTWSFEVL
jgi:hypothetical protein